MEREGNIAQGKRAGPSPLALNCQSIAKGRVQLKTTRELTNEKKRWPAQKECEGKLRSRGRVVFRQKSQSRTFRIEKSGPGIDLKPFRGGTRGAEARGNWRL